MIHPKWSLAVLCLVIAAAAGLVLWKYERPAPPNPREEAAAGTTFTTTIESDGIGSILVQVILPSAPRYADGAPIVVAVPTFFTPERPGFQTAPPVEEQGVISMAMVYPGRSDGAGHTSDGENDYGGAKSIQALRDVLLFALGEKKNTDGYALDDLIAMNPLHSDVGLYAFSHPGIAATNVLATYASELKDVRFFVGYENPTQSLFSPLELGHYAGDGKRKVPVNNPAYRYPEDYSATNIALDYSSVRYDAQTSRPYFDLNGNGTADAAGDYLFGEQIPTMFGKRYYSAELLRALEDNGALSDATWPDDLATPEEGAAVWASRQTTASYPKLSSLSNLHVTLVFAENGHVQSIPDMPNIHQAYDGLRAAGVWTRLNPDSAYVADLRAAIAAQYEDHPANSEPSNWADSDAWAFPVLTASSTLVPLAATLELADRAHADDWTDDLDDVLPR